MKGDTNNNKTDRHDDVALIVHACDRYKILYKAFEYFFKKHWPYGEVGIHYYFLTEEDGYRSDLFTNIKTGKGQWTDRLLNGLKQIPQKYIIYFQEDMWLDRPVDPRALNGILAYVSANNTQLFKLTCSDVYKVKGITDTISGYSIAVIDNEKSRYLMSHQVSVWGKSFLEKQLQFDENPWQNERRGTRRLKKLDPTIFQIDLISEYDYPPVNNNADASTMSRYYTVSHNAQLSRYALPYIEQMRADADKDIQAYALQLEHRMQNNLTHDGLSNPNNDDVFKKIKLFFLKLFK